MKILFELVVQDSAVAGQLDKLRGELKQINKELVDVDQNSVAFKSLTEEATNTRLAINTLTAEQKALKKEFAAAQVPTDSLAGLRLEYSKLIDQIKLLTKAERESESGKALIANAANVKQEINGVQESVGNFTGSVGSYKNGIVDASEALNAFGGNLGIQSNILQTATSIFGAAKAGFEKFTEVGKTGIETLKANAAALREFVVGTKDSGTAAKTAAASTGVAAVETTKLTIAQRASAAASKVAAAGMYLVTAAGNALKLVLSSLGIGIVIAAVVGLIGVFQRFAPVVDLVEQAAAGLSAVLGVLIQRVGFIVNGFTKIFDGDFSGGFDDIGNAVSGVGDQMIKTAVAAAGLKKEMQELEDGQKDLTLSSAIAENAVRKLEIALKDRTKSDADRLKIADEIGKIEKKNLDDKVALIDREIDIERRRLQQNGQVTKEQADQIAAGNFDLARSLEDEYKLEADQADRIRELLVDRVNAEGQSATLLERIANQRNKVEKESAESRKAAADKAKAAADKTAKDLESQIQRINELSRSIRDLDAATIINDFDRASVEIENKRAEALAKVADSRESLVKKIAEQKGVLTAADQRELDLISEQTASLNAAYDQQQQKISEQRKQAIDDSLAELSSLSNQVLELAQQNAQKLADVESEIFNIDYTSQKAQFAALLESRKLGLTTQLADGLISQKDFNREMKQAETDFITDSLTLEQKRSRDIKNVTEDLEKERIESARVTLNVRLAAIKADFDAEIASIRAKAVANGTDPSAQIAAAELLFAERSKDLQIEFEKQIRDAKQQTVDAQLAANKTLTESDQKVQDAKLAALDEEAAKRLELRDTLVSAASTISGALFEINRNRIDNELETATSALTTEYEKKKEAAAGNADELAKLDAEYSKKKEALEKKAAQKRKQTAITEAIINGALAVVKALPNFVLAALAGLAAAAQIAVISSQKFAAGGIASFNKSGRFGGRPHSAGGTRGRFDDGTEIEVEKDEIFVVLNRRASKKINQLSAFNAAHGGRRFADGGSLDFTPQFAIPDAGSSSSVVVVQSQFSDEQIQVFAKIVAGETSTQTRNAVVAGLDDVNRTAERTAIMDDSRNI